MEIQLFKELNEIFILGEAQLMITTTLLKVQENIPQVKQLKQIRNKLSMILSYHTH